MRDESGGGGKTWKRNDLHKALKRGWGLKIKECKQFSINKSIEYIIKLGSLDEVIAQF